MAEKPRIVDIGYRPRPWQAAVHRAMKRFSVLVVHRRAGKTVLACNTLIGAALRTPGGKFAYLAPMLTQAKRVAWDYLLGFTRPLNPTVKVSTASIMLPNGAAITLHGADDGGDSLRGIGLDGIVLDEMADFQAHTWPQIIRPALSDRKGFALIIGTPRGVDAFSAMYHRALTDDAWYAKRLTYRDTGSLPEEEVEAARREMTEPQFALEFECSFEVSTEDALIGLQLARAAANRDVDEADYHFAPRVLGIDVARFGGDSSVILKRQGLKLIAYESLRGADLMQVASRVASVSSEWMPDATFVDQTGVGSGVVDRLHDLGFNVIGVDFAGRPAEVRFLNKRMEVWFLLKEWLERGSIPHDERLIADLCAPRYTFAGGDGKMQLESKPNMRKRGLPSPDVADALALTFSYPVQPRGLHAPGKALHEYNPLAEDDRQGWSN